MATIRKFEDIEAWQKARVLCQRIRVIAVNTELAKDYRLKDQISAASGSIMDNIAEGFGRGGNSEFMQFLQIARGSANEVQSQLYRLLDCHYIDKNTFDELYELIEDIKAKILRLIHYLKSSAIKGAKYKESQPPKTT